MEVFKDISLFASLFNLISMLGNLYFALKLKSTQTDGQLVDYWKREAEKKEDIIQSMIRSKNQVKRQYEHQLALTKKLEGEVGIYRQIHDTGRVD